jgi:hypothetical protein
MPDVSETLYGRSHGKLKPSSQTPITHSAWQRMLLRRIVQHKSPTLLFPQCRAGVGRRSFPSHGLPPRRYNGAVAAVKASANVNQQSGEGQRNPNEGILDMLRLGESV